MKLYLVAGEASGDARGAELIRSIRTLQPAAEFHGLGGPRMAALAAPGAIHDWIARSAVIGIVDVLKHYPWFRTQFDLARREIAALQPAAVILIDYPGFNLRLAAALKKTGSRSLIVDYISPQVWAWNSRRIPQMARTLDLMICIFPFEQPIFEKAGLKTVFAGHPMLDSLLAERIATPREENLLALLPGSRDKEVRKIFPVMLEAAAILHRSRPGLRIEASAASQPALEAMARIAQSFPGLPCSLSLQSAHALMQRATAGMVASGTATLESAYFGLPFVLLYKAAWITFLIGRRLVKVKWLGMPNILAGREIVPEFLQEAARPAAIAAAVGPLLDDPAARSRLQADLASVIHGLGSPGAAGRAAEAIMETVKGR